MVIVNYSEKFLSIAPPEDDVQDCRIIYNPAVLF